MLWLKGYSSITQIPALQSESERTREGSTLQLMVAIEHAVRGSYRESTKEETDRRI